MKKLILIVLLGALSACGVKNDLVRPNGKPTPQNERDPSQPTSPVGR